MIVVYIEDNETNVELMRRILSAGGHELHHFSNGLVAIEKMVDMKVDLVFMDIQLNGSISGLEVTRRLRALGYTVPIIALTAYAMVGDRERCIEAGCDDYLSKPISIPLILSLLDKYQPQITSVKDNGEWI
ncbi:response regulator [Anaerolineales bacterium]